MSIVVTSIFSKTNLDVTTFVAVYPVEGGFEISGVFSDLDADPSIAIKHGIRVYPRTYVSEEAACKRLEKDGWRRMS